MEHEDHYSGVNLETLLGRKPYFHSQYMVSTEQTCKTCGNSFTGHYCNQCGEKVYTANDKSILHIADETLHFVTHFDGSFLITVKTIFTRPGKLAELFYTYCFLSSMA